MPAGTGCTAVILCRGGVIVMNLVMLACQQKFVWTAIEDVIDRRTGGYHNTQAKNYAKRLADDIQDHQFLFAVAVRFNGTAIG